MIKHETIINRLTNLTFMKLINFNLLKHMMALIKKVILQGYNAKLIIFRSLVTDLNLFKNSISHFKLL